MADQQVDDFAYDVFISYSHKNKVWVRGELLARLEAAKLKVCLDERDFRVGAPIIAEIERSILTSRHTLIILTPEYLASEWAEFEQLLLQTLDPVNRTQRLIPIRKTVCEIPLRIRSFTFVDFAEVDDLEVAWSRLLNSLPTRPEPRSESRGTTSQDTSLTIKSSPPLRLFVCHSSSDKRDVRSLCKRLQEAGFDPWLDEEKILPGQQWVSEIANALQSADAVLVCLSTKSITKTGFVHEEIELALKIMDRQAEGSMFLIPLRLDECEVPLRLRHIQWVNYFEYTGFDRLVLALTKRATLLSTPSNQEQPGITPHIEIESIAIRIVNHLLRPLANQRSNRSIILQGPAGSGKSWLLKDIERQCLSHTHHPIVLSITSSDFIGQYITPEELFLPLLHRLRDLVELYYKSQLSNQTNPILPKFSSNITDISQDVTAFAALFAQIIPNPYVIIILDGMDELAEMLASPQFDLLFLFESTFLVPIMKYANVRLLSSRRTGLGAGWRSFALRPRTEVWSINPFSSQVEQFKLLLHVHQRQTGQKARFSFDDLKRQMPRYQWTIPLINRHLIQSALQSNGLLTKEDLEKSLNILLRSPLGVPLPDTRKNQLFQLIEKMPDIDKGVSVGLVGQTLSIRDTERNDFISSINSLGIAGVYAYKCSIEADVVALVLDYLSFPA